MSTDVQSSTVTTPEKQNSANAATSPKSISSFYGNETNVKTDVLNDYENKMKKTPTNKISNRILSQPYTHNNNSGPSTSGSSPGQKLASVFTKTVSCSCSMATASRFQVTSSGFSAKLVDVFKTIPSRAYGMLQLLVAVRGDKCNVLVSVTIDTSTRIWSFLLSDYELVQERVSHLNPDVVITGLPKFVLNVMREQGTNV